MDELKQRMLELEHCSGKFEQYYVDYISNETLEALVRIGELINNDNISEYRCMLGIIRNIEYLKSGI